MPQFIMTYHGVSQPETDAAGKAHMDRYNKWLNGLDAVVPQQPLRDTEVFGTAEIIPMMGYTVIRAENLAAAREIAKSCPFLDMDGTAMQLSELIDLR